MRLLILSSFLLIYEADLLNKGSETHLTEFAVSTRSDCRDVIKAEREPDNGQAIHIVSISSKVETLYVCYGVRPK